MLSPCVGEPWANKKPSPNGAAGNLAKPPESLRENWESKKVAINSRSNSSTAINAEKCCPENFGNPSPQPKKRKGSPGKDRLVFQASFWGKIVVKLFNFREVRELEFRILLVTHQERFLEPDGTWRSSLCWKAGWLFTKSLRILSFSYSLEFTSLHQCD